MAGRSDVGHNPTRFEPFIMIMHAWDMTWRPPQLHLAFPSPESFAPRNRNAQCRCSFDSAWLLIWNAEALWDAAVKGRARRSEPVAAGPRLRICLVSSALHGHAFPLLRIGGTSRWRFAPRASHLAAPKSHLPRVFSSQSCQNTLEWLTILRLAEQRSFVIGVTMSLLHRMKRPEGGPLHPTSRLRLCLPSGHPLHPSSDARQHRKRHPCPPARPPFATKA